MDTCKGVVKMLFGSELEEGSTVGICLHNGMEMKYNIIKKHPDGLKVRYQHTIIEKGVDKMQWSIMLIPYTTIKYIRVKECTTY